MTTRVPLVWAEAPLESVALRLAQDEVGWLPVVAERATEEPEEDVPLRRVLGVVSRGVRLRGAAPRARRAGDGEPRGPARRARPRGAAPPRPGRRRRSARLLPRRRRRARPPAGRARLRRRPRRGGRRDRLRHRAGGAPQGPRARAREVRHGRRGRRRATTAGSSVDVASTRAESYEYPGALPKVEHAGIRSDLARRDFSINAMAVSLKPETYGDLFDYFGGREDLDAGRIVVLHNLSFIEDPTRILRAIRYESRYGLRMDEHTLNLARACCAMDLVGDLSSARLRDELVSLLDEEKVDFSLRRVEELGVWPADPRPAARGRDARARWCSAATTLRLGARARRRGAALAAAPRLAAARPRSRRRSRPGRCACACAARTPPCSSPGAGRRSTPAGPGRPRPERGRAVRPRRRRAASRPCWRR